MKKRRRKITIEQERLWSDQMGTGLQAREAFSAFLDMPSAANLNAINACLVQYRDKWLRRRRYAAGRSTSAAAIGR